MVPPTISVVGDWLSGASFSVVDAGNSMGAGGVKCSPATSIYTRLESAPNVVSCGIGMRQTGGMILGKIYHTPVESVLVF